MYSPIEQGGVGCARVQRKFQILTCLYDQAFPEPGARTAHAGTARDGWLTTGEIARCCGLSASPHLRQLLAELAYRADVVGESEQYRSNMLVFYWHIGTDVRYSAEWIGAFDAYLFQEAALTSRGAQ